MASLVLLPSVSMSSCTGFHKMQVGKFAKRPVPAFCHRPASDSDEVSFLKMGLQRVGVIKEWKRTTGTFKHLRFSTFPTSSLDSDSEDKQKGKSQEVVMVVVVSCVDVALQTTFNWYCFA